jgi:hypothetical protein
MLFAQAAEHSSARDFALEQMGCRASGSGAQTEILPLMLELSGAARLQPERASGGRAVTRDKSAIPALERRDESCLQPSLGASPTPLIDPVRLAVF